MCYIGRGRSSQTGKSFLGCLACCFIEASVCFLCLTDIFSLILFPACGSRSSSDDDYEASRHVEQTLTRAVLAIADPHAKLRLPPVLQLALSRLWRICAEDRIEGNNKK